MAKKNPSKRSSKPKKTAQGGARWPQAEPDGIPQLSPREMARNKRDMEKIQRRMAQIMESQDFNNEDEMNAYLREHFMNKSFDELLEGYEPTPRDRALDLVEQVQDCEDDRKALEVLREAVTIDPTCIEAKQMLVMLECGLADAPDENALIEGLRRVKLEAEAFFGLKFMEENKGHFWGMLDTRPYMRLRLFLVQVLESLGRIEEAMEECEEMLELNPNDNQGVRDLLRKYYLYLGDVEGLRWINKTYDDGDFAIPMWTMVFERWLSGDLKAAGRTLRKAHKQNPHVYRFLSGQKKLPNRAPDYYSPGDESEAIFCIEAIFPFLSEERDAFAWMLDTLGR